MSLTTELPCIQPVLHDQAVKVPSSDAGALGRSRDIAARLTQKARDGVLLESGHRTLLSLLETLPALHSRGGSLLKVQGEQRHLDLPARREHHGSFDDVLQLTEIAGPGIALEEIERLGSEAVDLLVHLRLGFAQEVMREDGDVLDALAERGEGDGEGVEAVEEVLAELPRSERLLEMTIGRRDDTHANLAGDHSPHRLALTRLEHAEEPALHLRGHVAHLIEEDRAPVRLLEQARLVSDGARERAPLVPEELGLEKRGSERRAVHGNERLVTEVRVAVNRTRHQLFTRAGLSPDEHGGRRRRHFHD